MEIDLSNILKNENEKIFFSLSETIENNIIEFCGENINIVKPIDISGFAVNYEGRIHLDMNIKTEIERVCSRCLKSYNESLDINMDCIYSEDVQNKEDDIYAINGYTIDITDVIVDEITAQLPMKPLCKDDCKGLCSVCGNNKNFIDCKCKKTEVDPRLQILSSLFEEK